MSKIVNIYPSRQPNRPHYIKEWADTLKLDQASLAEAVGADKSLVSRWYKGSSPMKEYQIKLAAFFTNDPEFPLSEEDLFRPPEESWITKKLKKHREIQTFISQSTEADLKRLTKLIEISFPKDGTNG